MGGSVPPLSGLGDNLPLLYRRVCYVLMVYYIRPSSSNCLSVHYYGTSGCLNVLLVILTIRSTDDRSMQSYITVVYCAR